MTRQFRIVKRGKNVHISGKIPHCVVYLLSKKYGSVVLVHVLCLDTRLAYL